MSWYILVALCFFIGSSYTGHLQTFDTVFLVDSSSSGRDKEKYDQIRNFVVNLTSELVNTHKHRVGIVSFSGVVYRVILKLTDDEAEVNEGLRKLSKPGGFSYVTDALNYVIAKMFNKSIHIGDGKQIITVLGGNPDNYDAITKMAKNLKSRGLEMYSVGIGPDFFKNTKELRTLASLPIKDHTLRTTYKSLLKSAPCMLKKLKKEWEQALKIIDVETKIKRSNRVTILKPMTKQFKVSLEFKATMVPTPMTTNILHCVQMGKERAIYGSFHPAIIVNNTGVSADLLVIAAVNTTQGKNFAAGHKTLLRGVIKTGDWVKVEIQQKEERVGYNYSVTINGTLVDSVINTSPKTFDNVTCYASSPSFPPLPGIIRKLVFFTSGENGTGSVNFDTMFLLDASEHGENDDKYNVLKRYVAYLTLMLLHRMKHHRVGIVSFSGTAYRVILPLTGDIKVAQKALKLLDEPSGFSFGILPLNSNLTKMFETGPTDNEKQVVTILGGAPKRGDAIYRETAFLQADGLEVYCVGVGKSFFKNAGDMKALASIPTAHHTLRTTYKTVLKTADILLHKLTSSESSRYRDISEKEEDKGDDEVHAQLQPGESYNTYDDMTSTQDDNAMAALLANDPNDANDAGPTTLEGKNKESASTTDTVGYAYNDNFTSPRQGEYSEVNLTTAKEPQNIENFVGNKQVDDIMATNFADINNGSASTPDTLSYANKNADLSSLSQAKYGGIKVAQSNGQQLAENFAVDKQADDIMATAYASSNNESSSTTGILNNAQHDIGLPSQSQVEYSGATNQATVYEPQAKGNVYNTTEEPRAEANTTSTKYKQEIRPVQQVTVQQKGGGNMNPNLYMNDVVNNASKMAIFSPKADKGLNSNFEHNRRKGESSFGKVDVDTVFFLDAANNGYDEDKFNILKRFVSYLSLMLMHRMKQRVGIVSFSGKVHRLILPITGNISKANNAIMLMNETSGYSSHQDLLELNLTKIFNKTSNIDRDKQVVVVFGGKPLKGDSIYQEIGRLRDTGYEIFCVGIGNYFINHTEELKLFASTPESRYVFRIKYKLDKKMLHTADNLLHSLTSGEDVAVISGTSKANADDNITSDARNYAGIANEEGEASWDTILYDNNKNSSTTEEVNMTGNAFPSYESSALGEEGSTWENYYNEYIRDNSSLRLQAGYKGDNLASASAYNPTSEAVNVSSLGVTTSDQSAEGRGEEGSTSENNVSEYTTDNSSLGLQVGYNGYNSASASAYNPTSEAVNVSSLGFTTSDQSAEGGGEEGSTSENAFNKDTGDNSSLGYNRDNPISASAYNPTVGKGYKLRTSEEELEEEEQEEEEGSSTSGLHEGDKKPASEPVSVTNVLPGKGHTAALQTITWQNIPLTNSNSGDVDLYTNSSLGMQGDYKEAGYTQDNTLKYGDTTNYPATYEWSQPSNGLTMTTSYSPNPYRTTEELSAPRTQETTTNANAYTQSTGREPGLDNSALAMQTGYNVGAQAAYNGVQYNRDTASNPTNDMPIQAQNGNYFSHTINNAPMANENIPSVSQNMYMNNINEPVASESKSMVSGNVSLNTNINSAPVPSNVPEGMSTEMDGLINSHTKQNEIKGEQERVKNLRKCTSLNDVNQMENAINGLSICVDVTKSLMKEAEKEINQVSVQGSGMQDSDEADEEDEEEEDGSADDVDIRLPTFTPAANLPVYPPAANHSNEDYKVPVHYDTAIGSEGDAAKFVGDASRGEAGRNTYADCKRGDVNCAARSPQDKTESFDFSSSSSSTEGSGDDGNGTVIKSQDSRKVVMVNGQVPVNEIQHNKVVIKDGKVVLNESNNTPNAKGKNPDDEADVGSAFPDKLGNYGLYDYDNDYPGKYGNFSEYDYDTDYPDKYRNFNEDGFGGNYYPNKYGNASFMEFDSGEDTNAMDNLNARDPKKKLLAHKKYNGIHCNRGDTKCISGVAKDNMGSFSFSSSSTSSSTGKDGNKTEVKSEDSRKFVSMDGQVPVNEIKHNKQVIKNGEVVLNENYNSPESDAPKKPEGGPAAVNKPPAEPVAQEPEAEAAVAKEPAEPAEPAAEPAAEAAAESAEPAKSAESSKPADVPTLFPDKGYTSFNTYNYDSNSPDKNGNFSYTHFDSGNGHPVTITNNGNGPQMVQGGPAESATQPAPVAEQASPTESATAKEPAVELDDVNKDTPVELVAVKGPTAVDGETTIKHETPPVVSDTSANAEQPGEKQVPKDNKQHLISIDKMGNCVAMCNAIMKEIRNQMPNRVVQNYRSRLGDCDCPALENVKFGKFGEPDEKTFSEHDYDESSSKTKKVHRNNRHMLSAKHATHRGNRITLNKLANATKPYSGSNYIAPTTETKAPVSIYNNYKITRPGYGTAESREAYQTPNSSEGDEEEFTSGSGDTPSNRPSNIFPQIDPYNISSYYVNESDPTARRDVSYELPTQYINSTGSFSLPATNGVNYGPADASLANMLGARFAPNNAANNNSIPLIPNTGAMRTQYHTNVTAAKTNNKYTSANDSSVNPTTFTNKNGVTTFQCPKGYKLAASIIDDNDVKKNDYRTQCLKSNRSGVDNTWDYGGET